MDVSDWLERFVKEHKALAGVVYERGDRDTLILAAAWQIPPVALAAVRTVHRGCGLVGLAFERNATLSTCTGGRRKRFALPTPLPEAAAVALPVQDLQGEVTAVVYLNFPDDRRLRDDELIQMLDRATTLARRPPAAVPRVRDGLLRLSALS